MTTIDSPFLEELTRKEREARRRLLLVTYAVVMTVAAVMGWGCALAVGCFH